MANRFRFADLVAGAMVVRILTALFGYAVLGAFAVWLLLHWPV